MQINNYKNQHEAANYADGVIKDRYPGKFDDSWSDEMNSEWLKNFWSELHRKNQEQISGNYQ